MVNQAGSKDNCPRCVKGKLVTDNESGETFCSKCGFVMSEKIQESGPCLLYTSPSPRDRG